MYPLHIPLDDIIAPQRPKSRETLPNRGRTVPDLLLIGNWAIMATHALEPLIKRQTLVYSRLASHFGERFREVIPSDIIAADFQVLA